MYAWQRLNTSRASDIHLLTVIIPTVCHYSTDYSKRKKTATINNMETCNNNERKIANQKSRRGPLVQKNQCVFLAIFT